MSKDDTSVGMRAVCFLENFYSPVRHTRPVTLDWKELVAHWYIMHEWFSKADASDLPTKLIDWLKDCFKFENFGSVLCSGRPLSVTIYGQRKRKQ